MEKMMMIMLNCIYVRFRSELRVGWFGFLRSIPSYRLIRCCIIASIFLVEVERWNWSLVSICT